MTDNQETFNDRLAELYDILVASLKKALEYADFTAIDSLAKTAMQVAGTDLLNSSVDAMDHTLHASPPEDDSDDEENDVDELFQ